MDYLISVLLSIVANLLTPMAKRAIHWPPELDEPVALEPVSEEDEIPDEERKERIRAQNRARMAVLGRVLWAHLATFFFLLAAFALPLLFKSMPNKGVEWSATRLGTWGADLYLSNDRLFAAALCLTLMFYMPVWLLSQPVACCVASAWDRFYRVTAIRYTALVVLSFSSICFLIAGHWIFFLFPSSSYIQSMTLPFLAVFGMGYFSSQRR